MLKIIWKRQALRRVSEIATWYEQNMGTTAMRKFLQGISSTVELLANQPNIGIADMQRNTQHIKYYSFVAHPKYKIVYYFNSQTLYVVTIHRTMMKKG